MQDLSGLIKHLAVLGSGQVATIKQTSPYPRITAVRCRSGI